MFPFTPHIDQTTHQPRTGRLRLAIRFWLFGDLDGASKEMQNYLANAISSDDLKREDLVAIAKKHRIEFEQTYSIRLQWLKAFSVWILRDAKITTQEVKDFKSIQKTLQIPGVIAMDILKTEAELVNNAIRKRDDIREYLNGKLRDIEAARQLRNHANESPHDIDFAGRSLNIEYKDSGGEITNRDIRCFKLERSLMGNHLLKSWCYLRSRNRSFRLDRILTAIDTETGEILIQRNRQAA